MKITHIIYAEREHHKILFPVNTTNNTQELFHNIKIDYAINGYTYKNVYLVGNQSRQMSLVT